MYRNPTIPSPLVVVTLGRAVVAMDRRTGKRVWEWRGPLGCSWTHTHVTDDLVVVGGGKAIACIAYGTGAELWTLDSPVHVSTWLADGGQLFVAGAGEVASIDVETGRVVWHDGFSGYGPWRSALGAPGSACNAADS